MSAMATLHLGGKYSDLTILSGTKSYAVHRAIVCPRSGFFDGACSNQFQESRTGVIDLSEDDDEAVEHMIHYFYYLDYLHEFERKPSPVFRHRAASDARRKPLKKLDLSTIEDPLLAQAACCGAQSPLTPPDEQPDTYALAGKRPRSPTITMSADAESSESEEEEEDLMESPNLVTHSRVYALAEKYDIPSLKLLAAQKFEVALACWFDSNEIPDAIEDVYHGTIDSDRGLRDIVIQALRCQPTMAYRKDVKSLLPEVPQFAEELWKVQNGQPIF
ncbi:hypothetical protein B0A49_13128 [Cryomyces minteri]|uniref:BTB domain-containing protein n=1 Tax=Cryomyces minteri TaxID=331657 RepID=A0A4U0WHJ2_9PEZI|nr:hypothetical protein B0A49_13128 [Cryomyces minteri]